MKSELIYRNSEIQNKVLLSFIIPTFKNMNLLNTAIGGIKAQDESTIKNYEIIVICNDPQGDLTGIIDIFKNEKICVYRNAENYGQVGNINQGINLASGKYVAFIHDDDMILPNYLYEMERYLTDDQRDYDCIIPSSYKLYNSNRIDLRHKALDVIFAYRYLYRKKMTPVRSNDYLYSFDDIYGAPTCGTLFLKQAIVDYGLFRNESGAAWDYYNYRMFNKNNEVFFLHKYLGIRRSETGMSKESRVKADFLSDKSMIINEEERDNRFITTFGSTILTKKPILKFLFFRLLTKTYYYSRNLDITKRIPYLKYSKYKMIEKELER